MTVKPHKRRLLPAALSIALCATSAHAAPRPRTSPALSPEKRAELLLAAMTPAQKYEQMVGASGIVAEVPECYGGRHVTGLLRLGIPTLRVTNGPVGAGQNDCISPDKVNASPGSSMMSPFSAGRSSRRRFPDQPDVLHHRVRAGFVVIHADVIILRHGCISIADEARQCFMGS